MENYHEIIPATTSNVSCPVTMRGCCFLVHLAILKVTCNRQPLDSLIEVTMYFINYSANIYMCILYGWKIYSLNPVLFKSMLVISGMEGVTIFLWL